MPAKALARNIREKSGHSVNRRFCFYPNKQMTTGEGGIVATNDENRQVVPQFT